MSRNCKFWAKNSINIGINQQFSDPKLATLLQIHIYACILWTLRRYFPLFKKLREYVRICECPFHNSYNLQIRILYAYLRKCIFVKYRAALQARPNDAFLWNRLGASLGNIFTIPLLTSLFGTWILLRIYLKMVHRNAENTYNEEETGGPAFFTSNIHEIIHSCSKWSQTHALMPKQCSNTI